MTTQFWLNMMCDICWSTALPSHRAAPHPRCVV